MKIIVTGALGVVGRGVGNAIRLSPKYGGAEIVGFDTMETKFGTLSSVYNRIHKVPRCDAPGYESELMRLLDTEAPDAVITTPEMEFVKHCELGVAHELLAPLEFTAVAISKKNLIERLAATGLVPETISVRPNDYEKVAGFMRESKDGAWLRAVDACTAGGVGARRCFTPTEVIDHVSRSEEYTQFQLSEYLPGRNLACSMVYHNGNLVSAVNALRLRYMLGDRVPSGITGLCDHGRVFRDEALVALCAAAIDELPGHQHLSGAFTVDLKEDSNGNPKITEINLRYIGLVHVFALAGCNIVQDHIDCIVGEAPSAQWVGPSREFYRGIDAPPEVY